MFDLRVFTAWIISIISTLGSLFFSEVMGYPPCVLCWYQRICMYPLILILGAGLIFQDQKAWRYSLPLAFTGWSIGLYHNLLYYKLIPESAAPCSQGISCTTTFIEWAGFITIPLLSLISFTLIITLVIVTRKKHE